jgi:amidase
MPTHPAEDWQTQAADIKARTLSKIPHDALISTDSLPPRVIDLILTGTHLTPVEQEIIQLDATDLRDRLADRSYTAVQVTGAYVKAAAVAHQVTNCLTDLFADEALERARWLDERYEVTGRTVGPLHGVPISVKVCRYLF